MLTVDNLEVAYGGTVRALKGVSLQVNEREVVALLGSNGAGKSTLLRAISGVLSVHRGSIRGGDIRLDDHSINGRDPGSIVARGIVQVPEGRRIFSRLTVEENLRAGAMGARDKATRSQARERVAALFPVLNERSNQRAGLLSGGEQQMLAIGRALMASPRLLLLDEPSLGLAPRIIQQIGEIVGEINRQGTSVLLVEQNASMALAVANRAYVLDVGKVSLSGAAEKLAKSDEVQRLYLGHDGSVATTGGQRQAPAKTLSRWPR
jgi:branched-chain amino acid transport system ATP-binding protein